LRHQEAADQLETDAERGSDAWRSWRQSDGWQEWNKAIGPVVAARRRALRLLGDKQAVEVLFDEIGPRFADRDGGYTRILRLATPRLGDAGARAILEFVGDHDRVSQKSEKPAFDDDEVVEENTDDAPDDEGVDETPAEESEEAGQK
jgi:large subunit ribosomal protein L17